MSLGRSRLALLVRKLYCERSRRSPQRLHLLHRLQPASLPGQQRQGRDYLTGVPVTSASHSGHPGLWELGTRGTGAGSRALDRRQRCQSHRKFGIVLDAGSSHTALYIYQWPAEKMNNTGLVEQLTSCNVKGPGISSYWRNVDQAGLSLKACLDKAKQSIPEEQHSETPVYLGATAGMRLLRLQNQTQAEKLLQTVEKFIDSYPFDFQGARIISGMDEGAFGWITINYLMGNFGMVSAGGNPNTLGALDLGGASTQITFIPSSLIESPENAMDFRLYGRNYHMYTHSFLCYGKDQAMKMLLQSLMAFSAFYYVMDFFRKNASLENLDQVQAAVQKFCNMPWQEAKKVYKMKEKYLSENCFSGHYILLLLMEGYNFTASNWNSIEFLKKIKGSDAGWTLGYMLNLTNMIPAELPYTEPLLNKASFLSIMVIFSLFVLISLLIGFFVMRKRLCRVEQGARLGNA
ncbi:ectonucleoside triphosphate diphosphohydrolase 1 isoform X5 [Hemitrygon akajei]|uniref:ectonucleoside triphosphate diphosphohydrolase 1 isoform X5 n=1 Tax=Hemitrygon akajei TaxID=2704970 RepID=UPI003BF94EB0